VSPLTNAILVTLFAGAAAATELFNHAILEDGVADQRVDAWHVEHILGSGQNASQRRGDGEKQD